MKRSLGFNLLVSGVLFLVFLLLGIDSFFQGPLFSLFENFMFYFPPLFSYLAEWWVILIVYVGIIGILFYQGRKEEMYLFLAVVLLGELLKGGFKLLFHIQRPIEGLLTYAYPSGHVFSALLTCLLIWKLFFPNNKWLITSFVITLLVGLSRIGMGVHWILDVLGGALLAGSLFYFMLWFSNTPKYRQFARKDESKYL